MKDSGFKIGTTLRQAIENTGWLFFLRILRLVLALFVGVWMARYLGPERFGMLNYALALVGLFSVVVKFGMSGIVVRDVIRYPSEREEILGSIFVLKFGGGILCLILSMIAIFVIRPQDTITKIMVAIVAFGYIFYSLDAIDIWFQSQIQSKYTVYAKSFGLVLKSVVTVILIVNGASLVFFAGAAAFGVVVSAIGLVVMYRVRGNLIRTWLFNMKWAKSFIRQCWPMMLSGAMAVIFMNIDLVMLREMASDHEVGIYSTSVRITRVWYSVAIAISVSVFPILVKSRELGRRIYESRFQKLEDFLVWIVILVGLFFTFEAESVIGLLIGEEYLPTAPILVIHIWSGIFVFMKMAAEKWLVNEGLEKAILLNNTCGAVTNVVLNILLIPVYSGIGAAIASIISYAVSGYIICVINPRTRTIGKIMSRSLIVPFRTVLLLTRLLKLSSSR